MFRLNLICQRMTERGVYLILGRMFTDHGERRLLDSAYELNQVLRDHIGIKDADASHLWPAIVSRHEALFGDTPAAEIQLGPPPADE